MKDIMVNVGKHGIIILAGLQVKVKIVDAKKSYGRVRYQVTPVSGSGETWTEGIQDIK